MKISDIWVMSWYFMRHLMVCVSCILSQCALFTAEQGQWLQAVQVCSGLCQWSEACTLCQPPAPGPGWARLLALTGSSCWLSQSHRAEAERRYTVSAGFSWPAQWRSNTVSPVIMAITRTPWPPASLMPHGDSDKWTLVWSPGLTAVHCALSEKDQASKLFVYLFIPMVTPEPWAGHIMAELGKCWAHTLLITHMQPLTVMDREVS